MTRLRTVFIALLGMLCLAAAAAADHIPGSSCGTTKKCASHEHWPTIDGIIKKAASGRKSYTGTARSDELLGHHGSDRLRGEAGSDILWGDWDPKEQPSTQRDFISGGDGTDFIYGSHGHNTVYGGPGNDAISVHYGRGVVSCGPGRDIYHVAKSRRHRYTFRDCEKVDYRPEKVRGGGLKPLK